MTYNFNRKRGVQGCMGALMVAWASAFIAMGLNVPIHLLGIPVVLIGLGVLYLAITLILDIFAPNPILTIGIEGIYFLPFSPDTVPWSDITSVTMAQGYYRNGAGISGLDGKYGFAYTIGTPSAYAKRGGISGVDRALMSGGRVPLNTLTLVDARWQDLMAAFREHYKGALIDQSPVITPDEPGR